jgi:hypothetical protein
MLDLWSVAKFIVPDCGDKVNSDLEVNYIPQSETMNWATGITFTESSSENSIALLSLSLYSVLLNKS